MNNYGYLFYKIAIALSMVHRYSIQLTATDKPLETFEEIIPKWLEMFQNIKGYCSDFGYPVSVDKCNHIIAYMEEFALSNVTVKRVGEIIRMADALNESIRIECEAEQFHRISRSREQYYLSNQFPQSVRERFYQAVYDMEEAGKCFALDRFTACAFHLMRVVESGLLEFKSFLTIDKHSPSWDSILKALNKHIDSISDRNEQEKYRKIVSRVYAIKDAWRNPTMHVENKYTEEEAKEVFAATKNFMKVLCEELS